MCNFLPKFTIGTSPDATANPQSWGKSFLDAKATHEATWSAPATVTVLKEFTLPDCVDMFWETPKKKKNYGRQTKHINRILKKMGR